MEIPGDTFARQSAGQICVGHVGSEKEEMQAVDRHRKSEVMDCEDGAEITLEQEGRQ